MPDRGQVPTAWWVFCRVIDNYGDAGVALRLARQLASRSLGPVHLVVDHWPTLARLDPRRAEADEGRLQEGLHAWSWSFLESHADAVLGSAPPRVLISAFSCDLPAGMLAWLTGRPAPRWILFDYLSAEAWIDDCHGRPAPLPGFEGPRHFFFPGFSQASGGLLREPGRPAASAAHAAGSGDGPRSLTLWAYPTAPWRALVAAQGQGQVPWCWHVFEGDGLAAQVSSLLPPCRPKDEQGGASTAPCCRSLPFQTQQGYDRLLDDADLNLVRGEDSWVRALWAAKPFLWQVYPQADEVHHRKLEAFLARYLDDAEPALASRLRALFWAWNGEGDVTAAWLALQAQWPLWVAHARRWSLALARQPDLVTQLVEFVENTLE